MGKNKEIKSWLAKNAFALSAVVVAIVNLWIASKLSPIVKDIEIIRNKVLANESKIKDVEKQCKSDQDNILDELHYLRGRVDQIYVLINDWR